MDTFQTAMIEVNKPLTAQQANAGIYDDVCVLVISGTAPGSSPLRCAESENSDAATTRLGPVDGEVAQQGLTFSFHHCMCPKYL